MTTETKKTVKAITKKFSKLNGSSFVGIKAYTAKTSGETANHVVNANFSYGNAVEKDLNALVNADVEAISLKIGFSEELTAQAVKNLRVAFECNKNEETASEQSIAMKNAFLPITNSIKLNLESGKLHIYALAVSKEILVAGEYKKVNSREMTLCQNAIKKELNFTTSKYRNFIIDENMLSGVNISGSKFTLV